ncbi:intraflagellar transport protein 81 isoform X8 [Physcomitrium patens]|uniref:intraflagellar transport protein 81 isoform X8 n=1 Tax=Physcomitrium patens TaxID=3218 RepID=UPI003CCD0E0F
MQDVKGMKENLSQMPIVIICVWRHVLVNHSKVVSKLHEVQELAGSESMSAMLQKMAQACSLLHYQAEDKLPKEMEKSRLHLQALQQVLGNTDPMDPALSPIQAKLALVNDELKGLKRRNVHDHDGSGCGEGNEVQRQQLRMTSIVANKIRDAFDRLADLTKQRDMLIADLEHKFHSIEEVKGSVRRGEDLKQYVELLRGKSATYKALKKELDDKATDYGVLVRTKRLLEQQAAGDADVSTFEDGSAAVYELIQCTQRQLEQQDEISVDDSATNSSEGHEKMCKNVWKRIAELDTKLQEQRAKVAPLLKQLKEVRTTLQDIETKNAEREEKFTETSTVSKRKLAELESAVNESSKKHEDDYKQLQELNLHRERLETTLDQLASESKNNIVSEELESRIQLQEELVNDLQKKQQKLKETEHERKAQLVIMQDLLKFLGAKLALFSSDMRPAIYSTNSSLENGVENDQRFGN